MLCRPGVCCLELPLALPGLLDARMVLLEGATGVVERLSRLDLKVRCGMYSMEIYS